MFRKSVSILLIGLIMLASIACRGHAVECALTNEAMPSETRPPCEFVQAHFHAHHLEFLDFFDLLGASDDEHQLPDDHDSLPGQQLALIFAGQSTVGPEIADGQLIQSDVLFDFEQVNWSSVPIARAHSPPRSLISSAHCPIYLSTLTLRI